MTLSLRTVLIIALSCLLLGAGLSKYYFPTLITKTNTVTVDHVQIQTVIKTQKLPNGEVDTTITKIDNSVIDTTVKSQVVSAPNTKNLNVSVLVADDFSRGLLIPTYGVSVTKQVLGPMTVGAFGLTNGTVGVSVGINF
jgi:hypothetical protein